MSRGFWQVALRRSHVLGGLSCLVTALSGCSDEFTSQMLLSGYRVIGIEASAPEVGPDDALELQVHDYYEGERELNYRWSLCLYGLGVNEAYECYDDEAVVELGGATDQASLSLDFSPDGLGLRQRLDELPFSANADGTPRTLERGFDIWVHLRSGPTCADCEVIDTVKRIYIRESDAQPPNRNPEIAALEVDGAIERGNTLVLRVETDAPESYVDPVSERALREQYLYSWYTTRAEAEPTRSFDTENTTELRLPDAPGEVQVVVAVRDGRGGLAVTERRLVVE